MSGCAALNASTTASRGATLSVAMVSTAPPSGAGSAVEHPLRASAATATMPVTANALVCDMAFLSSGAMGVADGSALQTAGEALDDVLLQQEVRDQDRGGRD